MGLIRGRHSFRRFAVCIGLVLAALTVQPGFAAEQRTRDQMLRQAAEAQARGEHASAITVLTSVLNESALPNDRRAIILNDRAMAYAAVRQYNLAFADFNASAKLFPENAALYNNRAAVLISLNLKAEALKDLDRALSLAPNSAAALTNRGTVHFVEGRPIAALSDYATATRAMPKDPQPFVNRARLYLSQGRIRAALRDASRALELNARNAAAYRLRAQARLASGEVRPAIEDMSRALAFAPSNVAALFARGKAYMAAADFEAAERDFAVVLQRQPRSVAALRERAHSYILRDMFEQADADLARALQLEPNDAETYAYRALMYKKRGDSGVGLSEALTAERLNADNPIVIWARAELAEATGDREAAASGFRKALELAPDLKAAELGLIRLGQDAELTRRTEIASDASAAVTGWSVYKSRRWFFARPVAGDAVDVRLETTAGAPPKLLDWAERSVAKRTLGVLTYAQGDVREGETSAELEEAIVIDRADNSVLATIPVRRGEKRAEWTWHKQAVRVAAVDGRTYEFEFGPKSPSAAAVAAAAAAAATASRAAQSRASSSRRRARRSRSAGRAWVPWERNAGRSFERRRNANRRYTRRRRRRVRTLFDLFR